MALYLASYDIAEKNHDEYEELWDDLDSLGSVKILYSEYAVPFSGTALELANKINPHLKKGDRLLVCELFDGPQAAWVSLKITDAAYSKLLTDYARTLK